MAYKYVGDKFTSETWRNKTCSAVYRQDGKCVRGKNGNMLVEVEGKKVVVMARLLRKLKQ